LSDLFVFRFSLIYSREQSPLAHCQVGRSAFYRSLGISKGLSAETREGLGSRVGGSLLMELLLLVPS
jgi:hypothetical protein